ncbi:MAG: penicillin-binding protein activator [Pseudomonadota bacterium]
MINLSNAVRAFALVAGGLALSACQTGTGALAPSSSATPPQTGQPGTQTGQAAGGAGSLRTPTRQFKGQAIGNGPVRVALLLPTGSQGGLGAVAAEMANAARLGVRDFGQGRLQIILKDTQGQTPEAALGAEQARDEGASLIMGPLLSANVSASKGVAQPSGIPLLAFTSDLSRAGRGTYLLTFPPQADVSRTISYAASQGQRRIVALLPQSNYGRVVEAALRTAVDESGGQVVSIARYNNDAASINLAARTVALATAQADAIYMPDGRGTPQKLLQALQANGAQLAGKQILGSGQWEDMNLSSRALQDALFSGSDKRNFEEFARRYQASYGARPSATAALAYDAVSLASQLAQRNPQAPFTANAFQSPSGFSGASGIFRFRATGRPQRGLVVYRVENGRPVVVDPAPTRF